MLNNIKVKSNSIREITQVLSILFENGHAWRGGTQDNSLSDYEKDNLYGILVMDTDKNDYYQQKAAVTFETDPQDFWSESSCITMKTGEIKEYYGVCK